MENIGKWAFIAGVVLAILAGFVTDMPWIYWVLVVLGLVVGFLNVTGAESQGFLIAAIGLILSSSSLMQVPIVGDALTAFLSNIVVFIAPAVLVVALKSLFESAKD